MIKPATGVYGETAEGKTCAHCGKHPAAMPWIGEGGVLEWTHGFYAWWCNCCMLKAQLQFARKQARRVERLEAQLANASRTCRAAATRASPQT